MSTLQGWPLSSWCSFPLPVIGTQRDNSDCKVLECKSCISAVATFGETIFLSSLLTNASGFDLLDVLTLVMVKNFNLGWLPVTIRRIRQCRCYFYYFWPTSRSSLALRSCMAFFLPIVFLTFWSPLSSVLTRHLSCFGKAALQWIPEGCKMWPKCIHAGRQSVRTNGLHSFIHSFIHILFTYLCLWYCHIYSNSYEALLNLVNSKCFK